MYLIHNTDMITKDMKLRRVCLILKYIYSYFRENNLQFSEVNWTK